MGTTSHPVLWHPITAALSTISDAVYFLDHDDRFTWVNAAAERLLVRSGAELVGRTVWEVYPDLRCSVLEDAYRQARESETAQEIEIFYAPLDRWFGVWVHPDGDGQLVVFFRDVHERRTLDEERAVESSLIRAVLNALPARIAILDCDGMIVTVNARWESDRRLFKSRPGDNLLEICRALAAAGSKEARLSVEGMEAVLEHRAPSFSLDYSIGESARSPGRRSADKTWWHLQVFGLDDGPHVVVSHTDITDRVRAEQRAAWQARHDHLTSLPNRAALHEVLTEALKDDDGGNVTVLYMDVDGFKQVNDSLGHSAGDILLRELASRLAHRTRPTDVVARLGGDEFVVVARDCDATGGEALAGRFRSAFDEPFDLHGKRLPLTVSIGIATSTGPGIHPDDLLGDADAAMYAAKTNGRNRHAAFTPELRATLDSVPH